MLFAWFNFSCHLHFYHMSLLHSDLEFILKILRSSNYLTTQEPLLTSLESLGDFYWDQGTGSQVSSWAWGRGHTWPGRTPNPVEAGFSWGVRETPGDTGQPEALHVRT